MAANENPWLWTVYSGAAVPVGFLVYFFWPRKKKDEANIDSDETQPITKGALEETEKEDTQEKGEDVQNNKGQNVGKGALEKEVGGKRKSKQKKKKEQHADSQQDGNKSNKSALDDELEEDYGITMSENGPILLRKRNIPKDELSSPEVVFTSHVL